MLRNTIWVCAIVCAVICIAGHAENCGSKDSCSSPNVRTVIFRNLDMEKQCWSREEIALLFTRRMMQELLPKRKVEAVPLLIEYFKECLLTVQKLATSKRTHELLTTALSDTLGGYLQAFGLPIAYQAFYEGTLCYSVVRQLNELQCALKKQLRTDGGGWTKSINVMKTESVSPLRLSQVPARVDHCQSLLRKDELSLNQNKKEVDILLPFLDDSSCPTAIAMPIKNKNLCGFKSYCCANILIKYYSRSVWCLIQTYGASSVPENGKSEVCQVQNYFNSFHKWLTTNIIKRLDDNNFYPAFGSILRIIDHLENKVNSKSVSSKSRKKLHKIKSIQEIFLDEKDGDAFQPQSYKEIMAYKPHRPKYRKGSKRQADEQIRGKTDYDDFSKKTTYEECEHEDTTAELVETGVAGVCYSRKLIFAFIGIILLLFAIILFLLFKLFYKKKPKDKCSEEEEPSSISSIDSSIRNKYCAQFTKTLKSYSLRESDTFSSSLLKNNRSKKKINKEKNEKDN